MKRRHFVQSLAAISPTVHLLAQEGAAKPDYLEDMTAGPEPAIGICHVGFLPGARKRVVVRRAGLQKFEIFDIGSGPKFHMERPLVAAASDLGAAAIGDFSEVTREGMYQIRAADELSPPFFIRPDAWRRYLPMVVSYHKAQRCGVAVPNVHDKCHLDDARRRDNGEHVDTAGGWHDAGDLRKWIGVTMLNAFGLLSLARNLGDRWDLAGSGMQPLEEEVKWGNTYFLKMQDVDGKAWADVAGGRNGDNSDNHWTDNAAGTADDRYLNPEKSGLNQAIFTALQAMIANHFNTSDKAYSAGCLAASRKCWDTNTRGGEAVETAWWVLAAVELYRAAPNKQTTATVAQVAEELRALQETQGESGATVNGFWWASMSRRDPYKHAVYGGIPAFALLEAVRALPGHPLAGQWRDAVNRHIEQYVVPLCARSAYGVMPFGIFRGSPTPEHYRPLEGDWTYRFFMPVRERFWWLGLNGNMGSHALLLATAAAEFRQPSWRDLAYRQLEWIFGVNPFGATLASGIGVRNPYPHSRYVGVIPGGIMNGICGNTEDEPVLDTSFRGSWRSNEYWSPHIAYFEWAQAVLESTRAAQ